jgi:hypothetical protein
MIRVGDCAILVAVFDDRTTAAMVRLHGQRVARRLSAVLAEGEDGAGLAWTDTPGQEVEPATSLDGDGSGPTDFARQTQTRAEQLRAAFRMRTLSFVLALLAAAVAVLGGLWRH